MSKGSDYWRFQFVISARKYFFQSLILLWDDPDVINVFKRCNQLIFIEASLQENIVDYPVCHNLHRYQPKRLQPLDNLPEHARINRSVVCFVLFIVSHALVDLSS